MLAGGQFAVSHDNIPCHPGTGALHLLIDSTGAKASGDGE